MPEKPRPLQKDMFTGKLIDNRTRTQKKRDKAREAPQQMLIFSQREMAQVGVNPRPQFSLSPQTQLRLLYPDFRTPQEIEREREQAALKQNKTLWDDEKSIPDVSLQPEFLANILQTDPHNIVVLIMLTYFAEVPL